MRGAARARRAGQPVRLAYADPPYIGKAHYYRGHRDYAGEVDHVELVSRLQGYDGWALSCDADSLQEVLALCPKGVRVAPWVRGERPGYSYDPLSSWEPVVYVPGRRLKPSSLEQRRIDSLVHVARPRLSDPERVKGAKPARFCYWMFSLLGALPGDDFADLFPGSGGVSRCWGAFESVALDEHDVSGEAFGDASAEVLGDASAEVLGDDLPPVELGRQRSCRSRRARRVALAGQRPEQLHR